MADTIPGDTNTTATLVLDGFVYGEIETYGDEDWFRIDLEAGKEYLFEIVGRSTAPYTLRYADVNLFDSTGAFIQGGTGSGYNTTSNTNSPFTAAYSGTFYVSAQGREDIPVSNPYSPTGTYRLTAVEIVPEVAGSAEDLGDGRASAAGLALDDTLYSFNRGGADRDWFTVTVEAGKSYLAELENTLFVSRTNTDGRLALIDGDGTRAEEAPAGETSRLSFSADSNATVYVVHENTGIDQGYYALTFRELPTLFFTAGTDWLTLPEDVLPRLLDIRGGAGRDMMSFVGLSTGLASGVEVNLATGLARAAGAEAFSILMDGIENVTGTALADIFHGSTAADLVRGLGGRDTFFGSAGTDSLQGGGGIDVADYIASATGVSVSLLRGRGWAGDAAGDRLTGIENLRGSTHADTLWGDHGGNRLEGGSGDDTITGNGGDDYILAGTGTDVIVFSGNRAEYTIATSGLRTEVTDTLGRDGHDILAHAEVLRFADGDWLL